MVRIHELSETLANQIAAGEVIERPSSVVKELVENSIDAESTRIRINFVDAGLKEIVVQDNGLGIPRNQIDLAFMRHATSKINNEHDLFKVSTLGFRGEALASIAAVSHVEILTAIDKKIGVRAIFSGGNKKKQEEAAAQKGTKITVSDLFFNTPARLKYLRSPRTEMIKIVDIVNRIALGYPQIAITLSNNGKVIMQTAGNGKLEQTIANVYGRHIAEEMLPFTNNDSDFKVSGLLSKPELTRSTRNFISILLNGRYIHNFKLTTAVMQGYGNKIQTKRYPIAVVSIRVDPFLVDVNVHPTKQEVRLSKEKELGRLITTAVSDSLLNDKTQINAFNNLKTDRIDTLVDQLKFNLNKNVVNTKRMTITPEVSENLSQTKLTPEKEGKRAINVVKYVDLNIPREDDRYVITPTWTENVAKQKKLSPFNVKQQLGSVLSSGEETLSNNLPNLKFIGQTDTYLIAEDSGNLFLIDQLSARRRLAFEKILTLLTSNKIIKQGLLTPIVLEFGNLDFWQIKDKMSDLKKIGLDLEDFGQNSFIVRSYPTWIQGDIEQSIREILDDYLNCDKNKDNLFKRVAINQAKKQVHERINLSMAECSDLIEKLRKTIDPYHDAEGNLILVRMSKNDLQKMFKKGK